MRRFDVRRLVAGARSVVVCAVSCKNALSDGYPDGFGAKIASYALAADYHVTIKRMLFDLFGRLRRHLPDLAGRAFVDSAPLLEKQLAVEAGGSAGSRCLSRRNTGLSSCWASWFSPKPAIVTTHRSATSGAVHAAGASIAAPRMRWVKIMPSMPGAAYRAIRLSAPQRRRSVSTVGSSGATPARAAAPTTGVLRSTGCRRSIRCSIRWPILPNVGWR